MIDAHLDKLQPEFHCLSICRSFFHNIQSDSRIIYKRDFVGFFIITSKEKMFGDREEREREKRDDIGKKEEEEEEEEEEEKGKRIKGIQKILEGYFSLFIKI